MIWRFLQYLTAVVAFLAPAAVWAAGQVYEVSCPPSATPGELQLGVTYRLWVPDTTKKIRAIVVHQHGCGAPACQGGATAAYDLHWQALCRKWDCALLGPSYQQKDDQNCRLWSDPRNGSAKTFLRALDDFAATTGRAELPAVPWCLWGHSGGGSWVGVMQVLYPERIVAVWLRSGSAAFVWEAGEGSRPEIVDAVYAIPTMCNPGVKEKGHERFGRAWTATLETFQAYRAKGAPIGFAPDPRTSHECGDSRYLAIPFFDACLAMRLPDPTAADQRLRPVDMAAAWLAEPLGDKAQPVASYSGNPDEAVWLPNERVAKAWMEYVKTGAAGDTTPPAPPFDVKAAKANGSVEISWQAEADLESGIRAFVILRDGQTLGQVPEKPAGDFGRPLFQAMSYHDTPKEPLPKMSFVDSSPPSAKAEYRVIAVNSVGLESEPSAVVPFP